jgi:hypothetical protein
MLIPGLGSRCSAMLFEYEIQSQLLY